MDDKADPSDGWPISDVQKTLWHASQDWYGKLHAHLHHVLRKFLSRLEQNQVSFNLYNLDVKDLLQHLQPDSFSRIEVRLVLNPRYISSVGFRCLTYVTVAIWGLGILYPSCLHSCSQWSRIPMQHSSPSSSTQSKRQPNGEIPATKHLTWRRSWNTCRLHNCFLLQWIIQIC